MGFSTDGLPKAQVAQNRAQHRKAEHDKLRELSEYKRESKVAKYMRRPSKMDKMGRGWEKIDRLMGKVGCQLA